MNRRQFTSKSFFALSLAALGHTASSAERTLMHQPPEYYRKGTVIPEQVVVRDQFDAEHSLRGLMKLDASTQLQILFIFGGGAMGSERATGGIWCPDSYEDMHILRTLVGRYKKSPVGFIPIACPPVFNTHYLGFPKNVFLNFEKDSQEYKEALSAFISSTQAAVAAGTIPIQPWYDPRFKLLMNPAVSSALPPEYGTVPTWQGGFRAADELQNYGVPNFWITDSNGTIVAEPFRGNVYHPHGGVITINYGLTDLISAIDKALEA